MWVWGLGFAVWGLRFGVWSLGFRGWGLAFVVCGWELGVRNRGLGLGVGSCCSECRAQSLGFRHGRSHIYVPSLMQALRAATPQLGTRDGGFGLTVGT